MANQGRLRGQPRNQKAQKEHSLLGMERPPADVTQANGSVPRASRRGRTRGETERTMKNAKDKEGLVSRYHSLLEKYYSRRAQSHQNAALLLGVEKDRFGGAPDV